MPVTKTEIFPYIFYRDVPAGQSSRASVRSRCRDRSGAIRRTLGPHLYRPRPRWASVVLYHSTALRVIVAGQAPGTARRRRTTSSWTMLVKSPGATSAIGTPETIDLTCPVVGFLGQGGRSRAGSRSLPLTHTVTPAAHSMTASIPSGRSQPGPDRG